VFVTPYPAVNAGPDVSICYNASVQLNAIVRASNFYWRPQGSLNNPNILNPIAHPAFTTKYILTATDTLGCPKPGYDTVTVAVFQDGSICRKRHDDSFWSTLAKAMGVRIIYGHHRLI
jgi:hypothetical protein